ASTSPARVRLRTISCSWKQTGRRFSGPTVGATGGGSPIREEPSAGEVNHRFCGVYPAAVVFQGRGYFFAYLYNPVTQESQCIPDREGGPHMLHATELMGAETYDAQGNFLGRLTELFIDPAEQPNRIGRLLLGRGKFQPLV